MSILRNAVFFEEEAGSEVCLFKIVVYFKSSVLINPYDRERRTHLNLYSRHDTTEERATYTRRRIPSGVLETKDFAGVLAIFKFLAEHQAIKPENINRIVGYFNTVEGRPMVFVMDSYAIMSVLIAQTEQTENEND